MRAVLRLLALVALAATTASRWSLPPATSPSLIAVANFNGPPPNTGSLETFGFDGNGNIAPTTVLAGSLTGIMNPSDVAIDGSGKLLTLHQIKPFDFHPGISIFGAGASGNVAPKRVIRDAFRKHHIRYVGVDGSGYVYALYLDADQTSGIDVFAPGANGVTRPVRNIAGPATLLDQTLSIVQFYVGSGGDIWWACDGEVGPPIVVEYAPGASGNATPAGMLPLAPNDTPSFAVNARGTLFVSQLVASTWVTQVYLDIHASSTPSRTYTTDCGFSCTVAAARGNLAVFRTTDTENPAALAIYDLTGRSRELQPIRTISGRKTGLDNPLSAALQ